MQASLRGTEALAALDAFMAAFLKVARVVFEDDPQRLERLGITVP